MFQFHPALNRFEYFTESHAISLETLSENNKGPSFCILLLSLTYLKSQSQKELCLYILNEILIRMNDYNVMF